MHPLRPRPHPLAASAPPALRVAAYRFRAKFVPYDKLKPVQVPNVLGQLVTMQSPGYVEFAVGGTPCRLEPVY